MAIGGDGDKAPCISGAGGSHHGMETVCKSDAAIAFPRPQVALAWCSSSVMISSRISYFLFLLFLLPCGLRSRMCGSSLDP